MVKLDRNEWPIVRVDVDGLVTLPDMEGYIAEMEKLLSEAEKKGEPYGIVYNTQITDEEFKAKKREKEAHKRSSKWLKENKPRFAAHCVGVAMVVKASGLMKFMKPIAGVGIKKMMGVPGAVFFSIGEGREWMENKLLAR